MIHFENIGYHVDYYVEKKYIGSIKLESPDRDIFGHYGRKVEVAVEDLTFGKKKIKKGQTFTTELIPLCGKMIKC
jgi:hypothetical protein